MVQYMLVHRDVAGVLSVAPWSGVVSGVVGSSRRGRHVGRVAARWRTCGMAIIHNDHKFTTTIPRSRVCSPGPGPVPVPVPVRFRFRSGSGSGSVPVPVPVRFARRSGSGPVERRIAPTLTHNLWNGPESSDATCWPWCGGARSQAYIANGVAADTRVPQWSPCGLSFGPYYELVGFMIAIKRCASSSQRRAISNMISSLVHG